MGTRIPEEPTARQANKDYRQTLRAFQDGIRGRLLRIRRGRM